MPAGRDRPAGQARPRCVRRARRTGRRRWRSGPGHRRCAPPDLTVCVVPRESVGGTGGVVSRARTQPGDGDPIGERAVRSRPGSWRSRSPAPRGACCARPRGTGGRASSSANRPALLYVPSADRRGWSCEAARVPARSTRSCRRPRRRATAPDRRRVTFGTYCRLLRVRQGLATGIGEEPVERVAEVPHVEPDRSRSAGTFPGVFGRHAGDQVLDVLADEVAEYVVRRINGPRAASGRACAAHDCSWPPLPRSPPRPSLAAFRASGRDPGTATRCRPPGLPPSDGDAVVKPQDRALFDLPPRPKNA